MTLSVLTIVRNRTAHLLNLLEGVRRSAVQPCEVVIVDMSDTPIVLPPQEFPVRIERLETCGLPLAQARNRAAAAARGDRLIFLDVDCIATRDCIRLLAAALAEHDALICADIRYLGPGAASGDWDDHSLLAGGKAHPVRPFPAAGIRVVPDPGLFWSLAFAIRRASFDRIGGFDESFTGYGGEDTDFGFAARAAGYDLLFAGGAIACHQYHATHDPPLQHFDDIIANARRFYAKWGWWPMAGWLRQFAALGLVRWDADTLTVLTHPDAEALGKARRTWPDLW